MKESRFSMAPRVGQGATNKNNSNIQSNIKQGQANNDSKNRRSTSQSIFPRATTFSSLTKSSDPRPIKDPHFQEECIAKILDFLIKANYDRIIQRKDLISPQAKDFTNLFTFMLTKIRPDWNVAINKLDEDVIPILNELRYPGYLTKSHLVAVGAPNTWPHLLAVLSWLVELASYLYFDELAELEETRAENENLNDLSSNDFAEIKSNQEKVFERNYKEFLYEGYKQSLLKGDSFSAIENFQKKNDEIVKINYENSDKLINDTKSLDKLIDELEKNYPTLNEAKLKLEIISRDLNNLKNALNAQQKQYNDLILCADNKIKLYESKCDKNKDHLKNVEELDQVIKTQKVSFEEFEKLKHNKNLLEKQLLGLNSKKQELNDLIWGVNNNIEQFTNLLNEKVKNTNQIAERLSLDSNNLIDLNNETILNINVNFVEIPPRFENCNNYLLNEITFKNSEAKEREEFLINLKSDLLKLEDKINEANEILSQRQCENDRQNALLQTEKEKYSQIILQKNEEIKKANDNTQKIMILISEKEKELDDLKQMENYLNANYLEEEERADRFIKDLEDEYESTLSEVEKIKKENTFELRKNHKNILKIFENIKKNN